MALGKFIDAIPEVFGAVIDGRVGSEVAGEHGDLLVAAGRGNNSCTGRLGELDGHSPNAAGAAVNEHRLAGLQLRCHEQIRVNRGSNLR